MQDRPTISPDVTLEAALNAALSWWDAMGVETPDVIVTKTRTRNKPATTPSLKTAPVNAPKHTNSTPPDARISEAKRLAKDAKDLEALHKAMSQFDAGTLSDNAAQCVFSRGTPQSKLMVIGEAPSREEDISGKPFMGPTGALLDRMLAAIGLTDDDVYITNVVNWRPPGNRKPTLEEIELCRPFFTRHIELAAPDVLLIVGGVSLAALTPLTGIMKNRGDWQNVTINGRDIPALPIYHPDFLRRRPELKKETWRDLLTLHARLSGGPEAEP